MKAIATMYSGVRFRSRLEAKWAAFFDAAEWPWEYEPTDLDGYIPDFILRFSRPVLAEVKPFETFEDSNELRHARVKIQQSGWTGESLILGARIEPTLLGMMIDDDSGWGPAVPFRCDDCGAHSFLPDHGAWVCRVNGCDRGRKMMLEWDAVADFRRAANQVQWRAA